MDNLVSTMVRAVFGLSADFKFFRFMGWMERSDEQYLYRRYGIYVLIAIAAAVLLEIILVATGVKAPAIQG